MQMFNPKNPCGRLEFFALNLAISVVFFIVGFGLLTVLGDLGATTSSTFTPIDTTTGELGEPIVVGPAPVSAATDSLESVLLAGGIFLLTMLAGSVLSFLLVLRRLTDLGASFWLASIPFSPMAVWLFGSVLVTTVPIGVIALVFLATIVASLFFNLWLTFGKGKAKQIVAPYGDNPYDPASWVPPAQGLGGTAVTYNGRALTLPGEHNEAA